MLKRARELCKSSECRRSLSWNVTFSVLRLMKYVKANDASVVRVLRKVSVLCCMFFLTFFLISYMGSAPCCFPALEYDLMFRNFTYINFAVAEISSPCNGGGSHISYSLHLHKILPCLSS